MKILFKVAILFLVMGCLYQDEFNPDAILIVRNNSNINIVEYREYSEIADTIFQEFSPFTSN